MVILGLKLAVELKAIRSPPHQAWHDVAEELET